ncbi:GH25 family lysozyme, partial [Gemelliphila palaticanis]
NGYVNDLFYKNGELGNWWYYDGSDWYFFKDGKKLTGYGKDNSGEKYFVNGKYANGEYLGKLYSNGLLVSNISSNNVTIKQFSGKKLADISQHNGYIDFSKLKNEVDGVIIRVGYGTDAEDKRWRANVRGAINNGIPYGFYWYSYALNETHAKQEAAMFLNAIKGYKPEYPIYIDMEDADYWKQKQGSHHIANTWLGREKIIRTHIDAYEKAGYFGGVYASRSWFDAMNDLSRYARWVAHWTENPNTYKNTNYGMHQYTAKGKANGVKGDLDLNISHIDYPSIIKNGGFNNWKIAN